MKTLIFLKLKALKMLFVMIMVSFAGFSQEPVAIIWDKAVGCQESDLELVFHFNVEDDGLCIKVCENSTVTYELLGGNPFHWSQVDFTASGGTITNSTNTQVTVNWGSAGWGSLFVSIQMLNGDMFEKQICIEKTPAPEVYFNIAPFLNDPSNYNPGIITVCKNEIIFFQNYSHPNGGSALIRRSKRMADEYCDLCRWDLSGGIA